MKFYLRLQSDSSPWTSCRRLNGVKIKLEKNGAWVKVEELVNMRKRLNVASRSADIIPQIEPQLSDKNRISFYFFMFDFFYFSI